MTFVLRSAPAEKLQGFVATLIRCPRIIRLNLLAYISYPPLLRGFKPTARFARDYELCVNACQQASTRNVHGLHHRAVMSGWRWSTYRSFEDGSEQQGRRFHGRSILKPRNSTAAEKQNSIEPCIIEERTTEP